MRTKPIGCPGRSCKMDGNCGDRYGEKEDLRSPSGRGCAWRLYLGRPRSPARGGVARDTGGKRNERGGDERRSHGGCVEARRAAARARATGTVLAQHLEG